MGSDKNNSPLKKMNMDNKMVDTSITRRKFKFNLDERRVEKLLNEKRLKYKHRLQKSTHMLDAAETSKAARDLSIYNATGNVHVYLNLPNELLPSTVRAKSLAAKPPEKVYVKPEHWIVSKKPIITIEERIQNERERVVQRVDTMKGFSRAAKCLGQARDIVNHIGPIRKKRSPVFDGLIFRK